MKTTKLTALLLATLILASCLGYLPTIAADNGMSFNSYNIYSTADPMIQFPKTIESTIYFPANPSTANQGGVILGNYQDDKPAYFTFEIKSDGTPALTLVDISKNMYSFTFNNVNVFTGKQVHIALTIDTTESTVSLYIDGVIAQTLKQKLPGSIESTLKKVVCIGGDNRRTIANAVSTYNEKYFRGEMQSIALYSDVRTPDEIKNDFDSKSFDSNELIGYYEPSSGTTTFSDKNGKGPDFNLRYSWEATPVEIEEYDFSFAVLGDTQNLLVDYPQKYVQMYDWIINNVENEKIAYVIGLGDITDKDTNIEWGKAREQIMRLNNVVPYTIVRGNHDSKSKYKNYFKYSEFGSITSDGSYDETMLNTYKKTEINGIKFMFLNLDCGIDYTQPEADAILDWANKIVAENPEYNVIVSTHIYVDGRGNFVAQNSNSTKYGYYGGEQIWDKFIKKHANICMVLSGHISADHIGWSQKKGDNGNTVTQFMIDPQGVDQNLGGVGLVAMFYFSKGGTQLDVRYYSTQYDKYFSVKSQITAKINLLNTAPPEETTETGNTGNVVTDNATPEEQNGFNIIWVLIPVASAIVLGITGFAIARKKKTKNNN